VHWRKWDTGDNGGERQLPEALTHRLEKVAQEEGTTLEGLVRRRVSEHLERREGGSGQWTRNRTALREDVRLPLISKEETGVILPISGADPDEPRL
jgi:hypothetical protein